LRIAGQGPAPLLQGGLTGRLGRRAGQPGQLAARQAQVRLVQRDRPALTVGVRPAHDPHHRMVMRRPQACAAEPGPPHRASGGARGGAPSGPQPRTRPAPTTPPPAPPPGSPSGNPNAPPARPARSAGRGNRSGAVPPPAGTGSRRTSTARSLTGRGWAIVTVA